MLLFMGVFIACGWLVWIVLAITYLANWPMMLRYDSFFLFLFVVVLSHLNTAQKNPISHSQGQQNVSFGNNGNSTPEKLWSVKSALTSPCCWLCTDCPCTPSARLCFSLGLQDLTGSWFTYWFVFTVCYCQNKNIVVILRLHDLTLH